MEEHKLGLEDLLAWGKLLRERKEIDGAPAGIHLAGEYLNVRLKTGELAPLHANTAQRLYEQRRGRGNIVLKARQMGMTTWIAGQYFLRTITQEGVMTVQVAQTIEAAQSIFRMVQRMWENLPEELRTGPLKRSRNNIGQMSFPALDSEFRVVSASDENAGRGLTIHHLHCSEVSRWPRDASATLAGLRAALTPDGEICLESTPNGAYGCFYEEWMRASGNGPEESLVQHFFPWWLEPAYVSTAVTDMNVAELELMNRHGLSAGQIGFRRTLEQRYHGLRAQEFAEDAVSCFKSSGDCCFEVEAVEQRLRALGGPVQTKRGGALLVWLPPVPGKGYIVAVDTAGGGPDGDYAAMQVIERTTGMQCAELRQRLSLIETAKQAAALAREYNNALLVVERNNHGPAVLANLESTERYERVYERDGVPGWLTTANSKPAAISRMSTLLSESPQLFQSRRLLEECRSFVTFAGGRTGAANGSHDDCLMAMAIAQAVRAEMHR
ncbi:terminase [Granulicella rosea]|uniref:phage terminase large subunit family protein n=1 Tax=Granulicella rosea TaxID=474952 RepID=UPI001FEB2719|nr:terminase [Granulicella rosea]